MKNFGKFVDWMNGKKLYSALAVAALIYTLRYWNLIDDNMYNYLMVMDTLVAGGAVGHKLDKLKK